MSKSPANYSVELIIEIKFEKKLRLKLKNNGSTYLQNCFDEIRSKIKQLMKRDYNIYTTESEEALRKDKKKLLGICWSPEQ